MSFGNEGLREAPSEASVPARSKKRRTADSWERPLDKAVEAFLAAETSFNEASQVFDGLAGQYKKLREERADEDKLREMEEKLKEARRAAATANSQWQPTLEDLRKAICSVASGKMWRPILYDDPEDVAQEVLIRFLEKGSRDDVGYARNWIHTTTQNRIIDLLRRERRQGGGENPPPSDDEEDKDVSEAEELEEEDWEEKSLDPRIPLLPGGQEMQEPDDQEAGSAQKGRARTDIGRLLPIDAEGEEGAPGTEGPEGPIQLKQWGEKLDKALDAAHDEIIKTHTKIKNPDEMRQVFEEMVFYELKPREIVDQAQPGSPYAVIDGSEEAWKRATNLVSKHIERYQTALKEVVEHLCPEYQGIISNLLLYVKSEPGRKASSEASDPTQSQEKSAAATRKGSLATPLGSDAQKRRQGQQPVEPADRVRRKADRPGGGSRDSP